VHAAACPQSKDYDNVLAFRHALGAWYFAAPRPRQPWLLATTTAKPCVQSLTRPPHRTTRCRVYAGPNITAVNVKFSTSLQSSTESGSDSSIGPIGPATSSVAAAAPSTRPRSQQHRLRTETPLPPSRGVGVSVAHSTCAAG